MLSVAGIACVTFCRLESWRARHLHPLLNLIAASHDSVGTTMPSTTLLAIFQKPISSHHTTARKVIYLNENTHRGAALQAAPDLDTRTDTECESVRVLRALPAYEPSYENSVGLSCAPSVGLPKGRKLKARIDEPPACEVDELLNAKRARACHKVGLWREPSAPSTQQYARLRFRRHVCKSRPAIPEMRRVSH